MKNKKQLLIEIYQVVYVAHIKGMIDENRYIRVLQTISENGFKTYYIDNFDRLAIHLKIIKFDKSHSISILLHLRDESYRKIDELSKYFTDIRELLHPNDKKIKRKKMVKKISLINKNICNKLMIAESFIKKEKVETIMYDSFSINDPSKMSEQFIKEEWFHHNRQDIIIRLHNLIDIFSIEQLKYISVDLINVELIGKMNTIDLQAYYSRTIYKIISSIKSWKKTCLLYVDVDLGYFEMCHKINSGEPIELNLVSFEITIV